LHFLGKFSKNAQISNLIKIRPVDAELLHADGRTDMMKLIVAFRSCANAPKKKAKIKSGETKMCEMLPMTPE